MKKLTRLPAILLVLSILIVKTEKTTAQNRSFKLGVNRTLFFGKPEKDTSGNSLESFKQEYGFTAALMTEIPFDGNEDAGVRFEMTYARKNFTLNYSGKSFLYLDTEGGSTVLATGNKTANLKVKAHYFELPIMLYQKFENGVEVAGGINLGLLIGGNGTGTMTFDGTTSSGTKIPVFTSALNHKYNSDETTTVEYSNLTFNDNGQTVKIPKTIGAYYENRTKTGSPFNRYNLGLNADLAYWFTETIGLRMRANYNFIDITSNKNGYRQYSLDAEKKPIPRTGFENIFNYQLTLDFKL